MTHFDSVLNYNSIGRLDVLKDLPDGRLYTYADLLSWDLDLRAELIDGEVFMMANPLRIHQDIHRELFVPLAIFLEGKSCKLYSAPFGVRLFPAPSTKGSAHLEPDIVVICDRSKLTDEGCDGAPDFIIEILSPSSRKHDRFTKYRLYRAAGVREYWIVDPVAKQIQANILDNGRYIETVYTATAVIPVSVLPPCSIALAKVFSP